MKRNINGIKKNNNKRRYTLIPEGYEKEYENYLYEESIKDFGRKKAAMKEIMEDLKSPIGNTENNNSGVAKDKRARFLQDVSVREFDHKAIIEKMHNENRKEWIEKTNNEIIKYCESLGLKLSKVKFEKDGNISIKVQDKDGNYSFIPFSTKELKNENEK